ncbi:MAG TPA: 1-acyl-sn-glycerol-3-phosphate acyltransferase [Anaeromyxobacteraceae bacterium]|nr:1-acyl-sn-glycerol-3-phosphate acyltransferase [Anaeromyxobacteraceae bacterium]
MRVAREAEHELANLSGQGSIVFVMRSAGLLNYLFLSWLLRQRGLPPLRAAFGLAGLVPRLAGAPATASSLEQALVRGGSSVVFLDRASGGNPFPLLMAAQRTLPRPVFLVPALLVWTRRPQKLKPTLGEILFGTPDAPSRLANAIGFLLNRNRAVLQLGRASDLRRFLAERTQESEATLGRKLRGAIHYHLAQQVRAVVGPPLKTPTRIRDQVLRDKSLRRVLTAEACRKRRPLSELEHEAERDLREIASRYSPAFVELVRPFLSWFFRRLYESVHIDEEGLSRVQRAANDAPVVLCPSHKSYIDFIAIFWALTEYGMTPPHVAAGLNLSFWPFGPLARRGGAFFIRRTLKGDRVYTATLRAYVKQLLRDRFPQKFYLEGGRSRSGKLLFPKTGLFSMEVDAWLEQAADDVLFVPVAIDYERLMESHSYARELAGGQKEKEDFRRLIHARKVLWRRYGRLYMQFEEPISLRAVAEERLGDKAQRSLALDDVMPSPFAPAGSGLTDARLAASTASDEAGPIEAKASAQKKQLVLSLANRVAYGISRAVTVTPMGLVAAALLAHVRRGLAANDLTARIALLRRIASEDSARFSPGLATASCEPTRPGPIADTLERLVHGRIVLVEHAAGQTFYRVVEERRPLLDYHKNAVIHRYVPLALVATSLRASGDRARASEVKAGAQWLSRLFKLEFMYRVGVTHEQIFAENALLLEGLGLVARCGEHLEVGSERASVDFLAEVLRPYLEAYRAAAQALLATDAVTPGSPIDRKSLVRACLEQGRAAYAAGHIALRESLSKVTFENAAEWFWQQGALERTQGGRNRLAAEWRETRLPEMVAELERFLRA